MAKVIIEFETDKQAQDFSNWLNDAGEQDYWTYAECNDDFDWVEAFEYGDMKKGTILIEGSND